LEQSIVSSGAAFQRNPLIISGNSLTSGDRSTTFAATSPHALLRSYLIFVRDMRGQRREPSIELRTDDVSVLAHHLGVTEEFVLGGLLDLMGATRAQRSTMMAMLAAGALTVVLTGSFVADLSTDGVSVEMSRLADAVQAAASGSASGAASPDAAVAHVAIAPSTDTTSAEAAPVDTAAMSRESVEAAGSTAGSTGESLSAGLTRAAELTHATPSPDVLRSAAAAAQASTHDTTNPTEQVGAVAQEPVSIGIAPDGSLVASVAPPVPATADEPVATAELPDGTVVGVATPPVPPVPATADEPVATAELPDGTVVGVAAPPVPPPAQD
jgi:hypothetical protein